MYTGIDMTSRLQDAIALLRTLPDADQEHAAQALLAFALDRTNYTLSVTALAGIDRAMARADAGEFADEKAIEKVFGRRL